MSGSPSSRRRRSTRGGRGGFERRAVIAEREQRAWSLSLRGRSHREIAEVLGVSQPAISKMLRRRETRLLAADALDLRRHVARVHAQLQVVVREAFDGFERSQCDRTRTRERRCEGRGPGQAPTRTLERIVDTQTGDPRFLHEVNQALSTSVIERSLPPAPLSAPSRRLDLSRLSAEEWAIYAQLHARVTGQLRESPAPGSEPAEEAS